MRGKGSQLPSEGSFSGEGVELREENDIGAGRGAEGSTPQHGALFTW